MRKKRIIQQIESLESSDGINLTPLIDVVFVVLIMFILVAPMLEIDRIHLARGGLHVYKEEKELSQKSNLTIEVRHDNSIWINKQEVNPTQMVSVLKALRAQNKWTTPPQLFHDKAALFGVYQTIKNALEEAGFEELDVILQPAGL